MNCEEVRKLISIYMDGELQPKQSQGLKDHLIGCVACRHELDALSQTWAMLDEVGELKPEPGFVGQFWTRLARTKTWHARLFDGVREGFFKKRLVPAFVAVFVFMMVGSLVVRNYFQVKSTEQMIISLADDDLVMVENMELVENFDLIQEIDFFRDFDIIENLDTLET